MIQPDSQGHAKFIRIRPYKPSDSEQVRELFKASTLNGVMQGAYDTQLRGTTACASYGTFVLGLVLSTFQTNPRIRLTGVALCVAGCALIAALRFIVFYKVSHNTKRVLNSDLKDITKAYGMKPVVDYNGERTGEYVTSGKSGFWVAEAYEKNSEIGDCRTEVIGTVGLDANKNSDETSAELRRMAVSKDYRRRGIAKSLIQTALHHAQSHGIKSVVLNTTMYQPAAIAMYEKLGWVLEKKVSFRLLLDRISIFYYSLNLTAVKV